MKEDNNIIDSFVNELSKSTRKTNGRDTTKNYHKITISVNQADKDSIKDYANQHNLTVSALIKNLLQEKGVI